MLSFRSRRNTALFASLLLLASPLAAGGALAQAPAAPREAPAAPREAPAAPKEPPAAPAPRETPKAAKELSVGQSAARERQKKCGAEWRGLSATDKAAQGPKWPQYFSKCVKRLKQIKA